MSNKPSSAEARMPPSRISLDKDFRLKALHAPQLLDLNRLESYDRITRLVAQLLHMPIVLVTLVDVHRQWYTGFGIPEKMCDRILDPFFSTKPVGKGTGQGLAITHDVIVKKHSRYIIVESETSVGTTAVTHR